MKKSQAPKADNKPAATGEISFAEFLEDDKTSDVTFICSDDKKIPVHRILLIKKSPAFKETLEAMTAQDKKIMIFRDVDSQTMKEVLKYIYSDNATLTDIDLVSKVYQAAQIFDLAELQLQCVDALSNQICCEKVAAIFEAAHKLELVDIEAKAVSYIME